MTDSTPTFERIPVPELPDTFLKEALSEIRQHSVSMIVADEDETKGVPCAGVFCTLGGLPGLLTARHVCDKLSRAKKLVLILGPHQPYRISSNLLQPYKPAASQIGEPFNADIPDIAFIPLSQEHKSAIEARRKVFYSIDRRSENPIFDIHGDAGFWVAIGSPNALMRRESRAIASLSYVTNVQKVLQHNDWDYLFVDLNLESNAPIPSNLEGMSGGGIWRVKFNATADRTKYWVENPSRDIILEGITFLQTDLSSRQLIAHGPTSIYHRLPQIVRDAQALK